MTNLETVAKLWHATPDGLERLNATWVVTRYDEPALRFPTENSALLAMPWRGKSGWYRWEKRAEIIWSTPLDDEQQPILLTLDVGLGAWLCSIGAARVAIAHGFVPEISFDPEQTILVGSDHPKLKRIAKQLGLRAVPVHRPTDSIEKILKRSSGQHPVIQFVLDNWKIGRDQHGRPWAAQNWHATPIDNKRTLDAIAHDYYHACGEILNNSTVNDIARILRGMARQQPPTDVHVRTGKSSLSSESSSDCYYDLGDCCIHITSAGWQPISNPPALFWKPSAPLPQPNDQPDGLKKLLSLLRLPNNALLTAWLVSAVLPAIERPALLIQGPQGSCKTTAARLIAKLLDNSPAYAPPERIDDWFALLQNAYVIVIDNVDKIPQWLATAICCCVSGTRFARRKLYSDDELCVAGSQNPVIITSIDPDISRGDLAERIVSIEMERPETVLTAHEIDAKFTELWPAALAELFSLASRVLATSSASSSNLRMASYAQILHAIGGDVQEYAQLVSDQLYTVATYDDFIETVMMLPQSQPWRGTARELLAAATAIRGGGDGWPTSPRQVAVALKLNSVGMLQGGVLVRFARVHGQRIIHLSKIQR